LISYFNKIKGLSQKTQVEGRTPSGRKFWWDQSREIRLRRGLSDETPLGIGIGADALRDHEDRTGADRFPTGKLFIRRRQRRQAKAA
jgi:hypothetical protein